MQATLIPTVASSATWSNPTRALVIDGTYSRLAGGAGNSWLILKTLEDRTEVTTGSEIIGFEVTVYQVDGLPGEHPSASEFEQRLQVGFTLDGTSTAGDLKAIDIKTASEPSVLGGIEDLWGRSWTIDEIQNSNFGVMIRRGDVLGGEDTSGVRTVGAVLVEVYFNHEGGSLSTMPERLIGHQRYVFGPEATLGTPTTPTTMFKHSGLDLSTKPEYQDIATYGQMLNADRVMTYAMATGPLKVSAVDYNELAFWLASRFGAPSSSTNLSTGVYQLEWDIDPRKLISKWGMTCQYGDENIGEEYSYAVLNQMAFNFSKKSVSLSGQGIARAGLDLRDGGDTTSAGIAGGLNCKQTLTLTGTPTGGTIKLSFKGEPTGTIAYDATGATVTTALEALTGIGAGNVVVTGSAGGPWLVEFLVDLAGLEQELLVLDTNSLSGGTAPSLTIAQTQKGGWVEYPTAPMVAGKSTVYLSSSYATLASNKVTELKEFGFESGEYVDPDDNFDNTDLTFTSLTEKPSGIMLTMGVQADADSQVLRKSTRNQDKFYARITNAADQEVASGYPFSLTVDLYGGLKDNGVIEAMGQKVGNRYTFDTYYDSVNGWAAKIKLVCGVPGTAFVGA